MNRGRMAILCGLIGGHLLISALLPRAMDSLAHAVSLSIAAVFSLMGVFASQVNLIAMWAVFAPGAVAWRLPWAMLLGLVMWCALTISNRLMWDIPRGDALVLGAIFLGGIVVAQVPLWIVRAFLRYRFYPPGERRREEEQFNMRQLLSGIALCCVGLGLMQAVLPPAKQDDFFTGPPFLELVLLLSVVGTVNLLLTLPCLWFALTSSWRMAPAWCGAFLFYCLTVTFIEALVIGRLTRGPVGPEEYLALGCFNSMQGVSIGVTLGVLRAMGFSWQRRDRVLAGTAESAGKPVLEAPPYVHPLDSP